MDECVLLLSLHFFHTQDVLIILHVLVKQFDYEFVNTFTLCRSKSTENLEGKTCMKEMTRKPYMHSSVTSNIANS